MHFLKKLHSVIDGNIENNKISKHYNIFSSTLIIISILLIILESFKELEEHLSGIIYTTETVVVIFFSLEYLLRLITSPYQYPNKKKRNKSYVHFGPIIAGAKLWVASSDGFLRSFDVTSGQLLDKIRIPSGAASHPAIVDGSLYVLSQSGHLLAYR